MDDRTSQLNIVSEHPFNAETPQHALSTDITPKENFYVRNHFSVPEIQRDNWTLAVKKDHHDPVQFSLEDLKALPGRKLTVVMECAGNARSTLVPSIKGTPWNFGAVAQAEFYGTALKNLLEYVNPLDNALEVLFTGADHGKVRTGEFTAYERSLPLEMALHPDVLLVWEMNGEDLLPDHGYPMRLMVPNWYGMASVKWLKEIRLIDKSYQGFFQAGDYVFVEANGIPDGTPVQQILVRSLILNPTREAVIRGRTIPVNGIAWSGQGSIVEVSISRDGGESWHAAQLEKPGSPYSWTRWSQDLTIKQRGQVTLLSRATDSAGNVQPMEPVWNRGGYGNNPVHQVVLSIR